MRSHKTISVDLIIFLNIIPHILIPLTGDVGLMLRSTAVATES